MPRCTIPRGAKWIVGRKKERKKKMRLNNVAAELNTNAGPLRDIAIDRGAENGSTNGNRCVLAIEILPSR